MKVLTLHQPWASLVALGVKTIETRSWSTKYRGPLAIHAATAWRDQRRVGEWLTYCDADRQWWMTNAYGPGGRPAGTHEPLPLGAIVGTCTLADVVPIVSRSDVTAPKPVGVFVATYPPPTDVSLCLVREDETPVWTAIEDQRPYGDFTPGRYAHLLADSVPVEPPVPFKGGQGLSKTWEPDEAPRKSA